MYVMAIGFGILALTTWQWFGAVAGLALLIGLLSEALSVLVSRGWMKFGKAIGMVVSPVMLGVLYYLVLTPLALAQRLLANKDPLHLKRTAGSNFKPVEQPVTQSSFEKMW